MRWATLKIALPALLVSCTASCYFLSSFDDLGGAAATASSGSGGASASTSTSTSASTSVSTSTSTSSSAVSSAASGSTASGTGGSGGVPTGTGGTGGQGCAQPGTDYTGLVLNELAPKGLPDDWIELKNNGPIAIALCGVMVTQDYDGITVPDGPDRFTFGDIYLASGKYLVIASGAELPFGLAKDAPERITLFAPNGTLLDDTSWVADAATEFTSVESWLRIPDGLGPFKRGNNPTKGSSNFELGDAGP